MNKPTHLATFKRTGEKVKVWFNEKTGEYQESFMVCLKNASVDWNIELIKGQAESPPPIEE